MRIHRRAYQALSTDRNSSAAANGEQQQNKTNSHQFKRKHKNTSQKKNQPQN
jgi:hypothetical protein